MPWSLCSPMVLGKSLECPCALSYSAAYFWRDQMLEFHCMCDSLRVWWYTLLLTKGTSLLSPFPWLVVPAEKFFHHHAPCKTFVYGGEIILFSVKVFLVTMTEHLIYESRKKSVKATISSNFIGQYISVLDKNHNISLENKISRLAHVMSQHTISLQQCSHFFFSHSLSLWT